MAKAEICEDPAPVRTGDVEAFKISEIFDLASRCGDKTGGNLNVRVVTSSPYNCRTSSL